MNLKTACAIIRGNEIVRELMMMKTDQGIETGGPLWKEYMRCADVELEAHS